MSLLEKGGLALEVGLDLKVGLVVGGGLSKVSLALAMLLSKAYS